MLETNRAPPALRRTDHVYGLGGMIDAVCNGAKVFYHGVNLHSTFTVAMFFPVTDEQAFKIAKYFLAVTSRKKLRKKGVHQIPFVHDAHFLALL